MSDDQAPLRPPTALPDFVSKPVGSIVPPRPPVLNPDLGAVRTRNAANPFAARPTIQPPSKVITPEARKEPAATTVPPKKRTEIPAEPSPQVTKPTVKPAASSPVPTPPQPRQDVAPVSPPLPPLNETSISPAVIPTTNASPEKNFSQYQTPTDNAKDKENSSSAATEEKKKEAAEEDRVDMSGGLMGWLTKTMAESKLLSDVAEKAKHGMEQVLTTLDPGMKGFLSEDGVVDVYIANCDSQRAKAIRDGFERVFANVLIKSTPTAEGDLSPLVHGSSLALSACRTRATRLQQSKLVPSGGAIMVMQPFLMDIEEKVYSATRLLLRWKDHEMDGISQLLQVDEALLKHLQKRAAADSKPKGEYSITVSQAAKELHCVEEESWAGPQLPYSFSELLTAAASAIALQFMNLNLQITSQQPNTST